MKNIFTAFLQLFCCVTAFAQDNLSGELKTLVDNKQFDKIIGQHASKSKDYPAKALYYIGLAYYMKEDDSNCLKFMDLALAKDPKDPKAHYIKASTLNYASKYDEAVKSFQDAIALSPDDAKYYSGLGDAYHQMGKGDLAIEAYTKATQQKDPGERPFSMIAQIYSEQNNAAQSLAAYYVAASRIAKGSGSYKNALFNIGIFEGANGNHDKAEAAFTELIQLSPDDFHAHAKLIQVYYARQEYDKAKSLKERLYAAYRQGMLKDNLKDMFCFDQFRWKDKLIQAFERYEEGSKHLYNKHLFYVVNAENETEFRIQTEYSPISVELGGPKYLLCMTRDGAHATFNVGFNDNFNYADLKKSVIAVLEGKAKPTATSKRGK